MHRAGSDDSETIAALPDWNWRYFVILWNYYIIQKASFGVTLECILLDSLMKRHACSREMSHGYTCALICAGPSRSYAQRVLQTPNKSVQSGKTGGAETMQFWWKCIFTTQRFLLAGARGDFVDDTQLGGNGAVSAHRPVSSCEVILWLVSLFFFPLFWLFWTVPLKQWMLCVKKEKK